MQKYIKLTPKQGINFILKVEVPNLEHAFFGASGKCEAVFSPQLFKYLSGLDGVEVETDVTKYLGFGFEMITTNDGINVSVSVSQCFAVVVNDPVGSLVEGNDLDMDLNSNFCTLLECLLDDVIGSGNFELPKTKDSPLIFHVEIKNSD